jgi:hypothetical protein
LQGVGSAAVALPDLIAWSVRNFNVFLSDEASAHMTVV